MIISVNSCKTTCRVSVDGIMLPQFVIEQSGLRPTIDRVEIGYLPHIKCVLISNRIEGSERSFLISYLNIRCNTGGKINCLSFCKNTLNHVIELPKREIVPMLINGGKWRLALILEQTNNINITEYLQQHDISGTWIL